MKHIIVKNCDDCPCLEYNYGLLCNELGKHIVFGDGNNRDQDSHIHPDCPLEEDHTEALMAALEMLIEAPHGLPLIQYSAEWGKAFYHAKAVLDAAKSARPQS